MRCYQVNDFTQRPCLTDVPVPVPQAGQLQVAIHACGLNFADLLMERGQYQETPPLPFTLGMEISGSVLQTGPGVEGFAPGDRIAAFGGQGGLAEVGVFDANRCLKLPDDMPFTDAAAFQIAYGTSHLALDHRARLRPGETILILGAAGGVGLTAIEIAKLMGARVIAVARGKDKLAVARDAGADHLIDSQTQDIREAVRALGGADVVYDPVGGDQFKAALRACKPEARVIVIGFASGDIPQIPANILLVKNLTVIGHYWGGYLAFAPDVLINSLSQLLTWYEQGAIKPHISMVFPLDQSGEALAFLKERKSTGKVVVTPQPE